MAIAQADLYTLAIAAGLPPARAKIAAAIAVSESGGNPAAHNTTGPDNSYGLWQINMKGRLGPPRLKQFGITSADQLFDPATNARAMAILSNKGADFRPWSTYLDGAYLTHIGANVGSGVEDAGFIQRLKDAGKGLLGLPGRELGRGADALPSVPGLSQLGDIVHAVDATAHWVSNSENWVRVGYVAGGILLAGLGLYMVMSSTQTGRTAIGAAKTAGKVAAL